MAYHNTISDKVYYIRSYTDDAGKIHYGIFSNINTSLQDLLKWYNTDNISEAIEKNQKDFSDLNSITIPIFGQETLIPTALKGDITAVFFAFQENPAFPDGQMVTAKIGFLTPDGQWVFLSVNIPLTNIPTTSKDLGVGDEHTTVSLGEGLVIPPAGEGQDFRPDRVNFKKPEDLYKYLGHIVKILARDVLMDSNNKPFGVSGTITRDGINIAEGISDLGPAPEFTPPVTTPSPTP